RHLFNRDITGGVLNTVAARHQHLPFARANKIALKLLVDPHPPTGMSAPWSCGLILTSNVPLARLVITFPCLVYPQITQIVLSNLRNLWMRSNYVNYLRDRVLRFRHWSKHPVVDHLIVFTIIQSHAFGRGFVTQFTAVRIQDVARADE